MRRIRNIIIATTAALAGIAGVASAAPLRTSPIHMRVVNPTHIGVRITATTGKPVTGVWRIVCGAHNTSGRFTAHSGVYESLQLPAEHRGACELTFTASGAGYGTIDARAWATSR